jgi:1-acyl-sn-glycerol-3-phosphate acyltransferase
VANEALRTLVEACFRVLFSYECLGTEWIPARGPAIVAANHPSYLDPVLLSLSVARPIRFMAWERILRVPLLGALARLFGAFPVDLTPGQGRSAYEAAKRLVEEGELVGIFPEGRRSRAGFLEPELREGAARLALETGAPLVPVTIRGAFRAWPHFRRLPGFVQIQVRYHEPIDPAPFRTQPKEAAIAALLAELRRRVDRTLMPGVKADARIESLYRGAAPWPRLFEAGPALGLALLVFWKARAFAAVWPCYAYVGYLLADLLLIPQRRSSKRLRNASAAVFTLAYLGWALPSLGLPRPVGGAALAGVLAGAAFPYLYERGRTALGFMRGLVAAALLETGALALARTPLGPHLALPLFAAAFAWEERSVFWRYAAPVLAAYALVVPLWLGGRVELLPHALAGLAAWMVVRFLSAGTSAEADEAGPDSPTSSLGLRD